MGNRTDGGASKGSLDRKDLFTLAKMLMELAGFFVLAYGFMLASYHNLSLPRHFEYEAYILASKIGIVLLVAAGLIAWFLGTRRK